MLTFTAAAARRDLADIIRLVRSTGKEAVITRYGLPLVAIIPVEELWRICAIARELMRGEHNIGRIIARPFLGTGKGHFKRTANRKDFSVKPAGLTVVERAFNSGHSVCR